jgi:hypothetical protein
MNSPAGLLGACTLMFHTRTQRSTLLVTSRGLRMHTSMPVMALEPDRPVVGTRASITENFMSSG